MVWTFVVSALVTAAYVSLRTMQQLNIIHQCYWRIPFVSIAMGVGDVALILMMVRADTLAIGVTNGIGGAVGCLVAIYLHKRMG